MGKGVPDAEKAELNSVKDHHAAAVADMPRFLKFGRLSTMKLVLVAITSLLLASEAQPTVLKLERPNALPGGGVVELPVNGTGKYMFHGPYLTRVMLGNPPQSFDVLIDTGSILPWIGCETARIPTRLFYPASSTSVLGCSDHSCQALESARAAKCNTSNNRCAYDLGYGNGDNGTASNAVGYYISDLVHLNGLSTPARIVFGCTTSWSGQLTRGGFDGIFGLSPFGMSFISQLYSLGISGKVFTLCMHSPTGGGILAFGEALEPGLTYTPLLPSPQYYQVNLQSIAVNGQTLPIESSVFGPSPSNFTFVDSGTTLAYLADGAYEPFISAIRAATPPSELPFTGENGEICFATSTSIDSAFPSVELDFVGGAKMFLYPHNYMYYVKPSVYCIGWLRNTGRQVTLLGDIVLVDKILVHDLEKKRLGWMNYDCSQPINVTTARGKKHTNSGQSLHSITTSFTVVLVVVIYITLLT
uniref:Peptidase A1 domain-containing protein n=1 Tax=Triticum urartu TaxID=4572 RepID=A0A8R7Q1F0_TRIUA